MKCWMFHGSVIGELGVKVVVCIGKGVGGWVGTHLKANTFVDASKDKKNVAYKNQAGLIVVSLVSPMAMAAFNAEVAAKQADLVKRALAHAAAQPKPPSTP